MIGIFEAGGTKTEFITGNSEKLIQRTGPGIHPMFMDEEAISKVLAELTASLDLTVTPCTSTLKRICKRAGLNWKRVRKSLRSKRDPDLFEQSRQQLAMLIEQANQKEIDLFYFDESGFTLEPCVPYAWQPRGETIEVPCAKSKRQCMDSRGQRAVPTNELKILRY
jgi:hypothetical protein